MNTPLTEPVDSWILCHHESGHYYYYNRFSGESVWTCKFGSTSYDMNNKREYNSRSENNQRVITMDIETGKLKKWISSSFTSASIFNIVSTFTMYQRQGYQILDVDLNPDFQNCFKEKNNWAGKWVEKISRKNW